MAGLMLVALRTIERVQVRWAGASSNLVREQDTWMVFVHWAWPSRGPSESEPFTCSWSGAANHYANASIPLFRSRPVGPRPLGCPSLCRARPSRLASRAAANRPAGRVPSAGMKTQAVAFKDSVWRACVLLGRCSCVRPTSLVIYASSSCIFLMPPRMTAHVLPAPTVGSIASCKARVPIATRTPTGGAVRHVARKQHQRRQHHHQQQDGCSRARPSAAARTAVRLCRTGLLPLGAVQPAHRTRLYHIPGCTNITGTRNNPCATTNGRLHPQHQHKHWAECRCLQ